MGRQCVSCRSERREDLDAELKDLLRQASGEPSRIPFPVTRGIAERYGIAPRSLRRHFTNHLAVGRLSQEDQRIADAQTHAAAVAAARAARQLAAGAAAGEDADPAAVALLAELDGHARMLDSSLERMELKGDDRGVRDGITAAKGLVHERARILGLLAPRKAPCPPPPPVADSPEFAAAVAVLMAPLVKYPDARAAVVAAIESVRSAGA